MTLGFTILLATLIGASIICKKFLGYSHVKFIEVLAREFKDVLSLKPTPAAVNAVVIVINALLFLIYFASSSLEKLVRLAFSVQNEVAGAKFGELIASSLVISLVGLLCVLMCSRSR